MKTVVIGKLCCHKGCPRVGRVARKLNDFWVVTCGLHEGAEILLNFKKIPSPNGDPRDDWNQG